MIKNFTKKAIIESVKTFQKRKITSGAFQNIKDIKTRELSIEERDFLENQDMFTIASIGSDGWPYMESVRGDRGFIKVLSTTQIAFINCKDNLQCIPFNEELSTNRAVLTVTDYPTGLSLKIWVEVMLVGSDDKTLRRELIFKEHNTVPIDHFVVMNIKAFDWSCPSKKTARYCKEEFKTMLNNNEISLDCETAKRQLIKYLREAENFKD